MYVLKIGENETVAEFQFASTYIHIHTYNVEIVIHLAIRMRETGS